jgi:ABC-type transport system involved in cytochrome c biogenesis permease subunit
VSSETWARISTDAFTVAFFAYLAAMLAAFHHLAFRKRPVWVASIGLAVVGASAQFVSLVARGAAAGRIPLGNMYEYSLALSFLVVVAYLVFVEGLARVRTLGGFVLAFATITMAIAALFLHVGPAPLVPALNSYWRQIHVTSMIVS